jgi:hypothetical protein
VFYRFTLTAPEIVYADTIGTPWDTALFFLSSSGTTVASANLTNGLACNDDGGLSGCSLSPGPSQVMVQLNAGTWYLVLSGCQSGMANVRFHHLPVGNGTLTPLAAGADQVLSGTTSGTGRVNTTSCCSGGPENTYYWYTCSTFAGGAFSATTCLRASWDTELEQRSAGRAVVSDVQRRRRRHPLRSPLARQHHDPRGRGPPRALRRRLHRQHRVRRLLGQRHPTLIAPPPPAPLS